MRAIVRPSVAGTQPRTVRREVSGLKPVPTSRTVEVYEQTEWLWCEACEEPHHEDEAGPCADACSRLFLKTEKFRPQKVVRDDG